MNLVEFMQAIHAMAVASHGCVGRELTTLGVFTIGMVQNRYEDRHGFVCDESESICFDLDLSDGVTKNNLGNVSGVVAEGDSTSRALELKMNEESRKAQNTRKGLLALLVPSAVLGLLCLFAISAVALISFSVIVDGGNNRQTQYRNLLSLSSPIPEESLVVKRDKVMEAYIGEYEFMALVVPESGAVVYAYDILSDWPQSGTEYHLVELAEPGITYIINNGYPNVSITNRDEIDQYITQAALWVYLDEIEEISSANSSLSEDGKEAYPGIIDAVNILVTGAMSAHSGEYSILGMSYRDVYIYENPLGQTDRIVVCATEQAD